MRAAACNDFNSEANYESQHSCLLARSTPASSRETHVEWRLVAEDGASSARCAGDEARGTGRARGSVAGQGELVVRACKCRAEQSRAKQSSNSSEQGKEGSCVMAVHASSSTRRCSTPVLWVWTRSSDCTRTCRASDARQRVWRGIVASWAALRANGAHNACTASGARPARALRDWVVTACAAGHAAHC